jgi:hypothetical protein
MPPPDNTHESRGLLTDARTLTILGAVAIGAAVVGALIAYFAR